MLSLPACQPLSTWQVALKQLIPDNEVSLFGGALKFRAKVAWRAVCFCFSIGADTHWPASPAAPTPCWMHWHMLPNCLPLFSPVVLQHLPGLYVLGASAASSLIGGATHILPFTLFGSYFAWAYLRFVQMRNGVRWETGCCFGLERDGCRVRVGPQMVRVCAHWIRSDCNRQHRRQRPYIHPAGVAIPAAGSACSPLPCRGDLSDEFRLASFFPQLLHPAIDRLAAACTRVTGLGNAAGSQQHQAAWRSALVGGAALPGSLDVADDAARRRWVAGRGCVAVTKASIIRGCVETARQLGCCWRCGVAQAGAKGLLVLLRGCFATACV